MLPRVGLRGRRSCGEESRRVRRAEPWARPPWGRGESRGCRSPECGEERPQVPRAGPRGRRLRGRGVGRRRGRPRVGLRGRLPPGCVEGRRPRVRSRAGRPVRRRPRVGPRDPRASAGARHLRPAGSRPSPGAGGGEGVGGRRRLLGARVGRRGAALERGLRGRAAAAVRRGWRGAGAGLTVRVRGYWVFGGRLRCPRPGRRLGGPATGLVGLAGRYRPHAGGLGHDVRDADAALVLHRPASTRPGPRRTLGAATGSRAVVLVRHSVSFRTISTRASSPAGDDRSPGGFRYRTDTPRS